MTHLQDEDEDIWSDEEIAEFKKRGPFHAEQRFSKPYRDVLKRIQRHSCYAILDASGVEVAYSELAEQAIRWARELTQKGYIED